MVHILGQLGVDGLETNSVYLLDTRKGQKMKLVNTVTVKPWNSRITLVDLREDGGKWGLRCENHGATWLTFNTRALALDERQNPDSWCEDCRASLTWFEAGMQDSEWVEEE